MEIRLHPEKEAQLVEIAGRRGLKVDELVRLVLSRYLEDDTRFVEAVNVGFAAPDRGDPNEHEGPGGLGTEISSLFAKDGLDFEIEEIRGAVIEPPSFD